MAKKKSEIQLLNQSKSSSISSSGSSTTSSSTSINTNTPASPPPPKKTDGLFKLHSHNDPSGDQPIAIEALYEGLKQNKKYQTLLGVTGSGKTFTMAHVIAKHEKPTLILAHNKTLAAQLYGELKALFPENAVSYFVSYYDYYRPEAYIPSTDVFIEKDSQVNEEIDRLRHKATQSLLERKDVIVVASVSCIYGLGSPENYQAQQLRLIVGKRLNRELALAKLVDIQYTRNDTDFYRGCFRVRGDVIEIYPASEDDFAIRVSLFGDEIESISVFDPLRGKVVQKKQEMTIYPASHYVASEDVLKKAFSSIQKELEERLPYFSEQGRVLEIQRLTERTVLDLEMIKETGFCKGIENYTRHLTGAKPGEPPPCLLDYFPKDDWLLIVDESHVSLPQIKAMFGGDFSRKSTLVEYGFRLPSALDNRPLKYDEFMTKLNQCIFVSATPSEEELRLCNYEVAEQVIRPTGLLDPVVEVRPLDQQVDDLLGEIRKVVAQNQRVLVTTMTKRMAEDLTTYYYEIGIRVKYLHSEIETIERSALLRDLRLGVFDVLVGINLLREGLDLPEVALVGIMDADKEGFLRNRSALIQTIGRAARNLNGRVILYANKMTDSIQYALSETNRRRQLQESYNLQHGITPRSIQRSITDLGMEKEDIILDDALDLMDFEGQKEDLMKQIEQTKAQMLELAKALKFEEAVTKREELKELEMILLKMG
jgi:excinuclease ABC subunit B